MLFLESCIVYVITMAGGILLGVVLSKLLFLLLLRLSNVPLDVDFVFKMKAFTETLIYFGIVFLLLFLSQLWEVGKARPAELMSGSRKGEKEPRLLVLWSVIGAAALIFGYRASIGAQADSMILIDFALAILLVVIGTYLLLHRGACFS